MAKLNARGRIELARVAKENKVTDSDLISWERTTFALMSDRKVLIKRDVQFKTDNRTHTYGWKLHYKLNMDITPESFVSIAFAGGYLKV